MALRRPMASRDPDGWRTGVDLRLTTSTVSSLCAGPGLVVDDCGEGTLDGGEGLGGGVVGDVGSSGPGLDDDRGERRLGGDGLGGGGDAGSAGSVSTRSSLSGAAADGDTACNDDDEDRLPGGRGRGGLGGSGGGTLGDVGDRTPPLPTQS